MLTLGIEEFLRSSQTNPVVDVRSPAEFARGHIPGAVNIPLFNDKERARIGTTYKQVSRESAISEGLEIVEPKMSDMVSQCRKLDYRDHLLVHCWRGGMRSESFAWLMNTAGLKAVTLENGYKNYRNYGLRTLSKLSNLILIAGSTGSGKTEVLRMLRETGEQVVDLESIAKHKGSVFGAMGQGPQPTTEHFQNLLFDEFNQLDLNERIWLEDESIGIGNVFIPRELWKRMHESPLIRLELDKSLRIERLVREYGHFDKSLLEEKILKISKRLGGQALKESLINLYSNNLATTVDLILSYYDKAYNNSIQRKHNRLMKTIELSQFDSREIASQLINTANNILTSEYYE